VRAQKIFYLIAIVAGLVFISLLVIGIVGMNKTAPKYVMIHFDDGFKSQYDHAYPILKQYGLKGTFWIVCDNASGEKPLYMRWPEVDQLVADGQDIQNHGMTHARLPALTDKQIEVEVGGCKDMVVRHGSTGAAYAIPFNEGNDDRRIVTAISKIHSYGKGDGGNPQPADCGGNCEILNDDGTYNKHNRYTMVQWSHDVYSKGRTEQEILDGFIQAVNSGIADSEGIVKIPIITYHRINEGGASPSTSLFESEMKYLRDNGFRAIGMDDITYDPVAKKFKLK
jgi:peptidoglycan/xylan/chitin deacetylase (PgdA/CDA1 family)